MTAVASIPIFYLDFAFSKNLYYDPPLSAIPCEVAMHRVIIAFAALPTLLACGAGQLFAPTVTPTPDPCAPDLVLAAVEEGDVLYREFADGVDLAGSTPRVSLAPMIADLQEIRRDAEALDM